MDKPAPSKQSMVMHLL